PDAARALAGGAGGGVADDGGGFGDLSRARVGPRSSSSKGDCLLAGYALAGSRRGRGRRRFPGALAIALHIGPRTARCAKRGFGARTRPPLSSRARNPSPPPPPRGFTSSLRPLRRSAGKGERGGVQMRYWTSGS